ncbi:2'-5' RNA ligase family protein [Paenibacillus oceani]|uniref:2'-5' RNA ligase family protein n=1 Tax=Paenibacillus oceani TaxID=2772510 RepID=A0A927H1C3_9BACL|nr:2'-5' RNA ligase family protein [Paenibacillus oceani]MBD2864032.1 2'-5' RNA ligase family protein [Paenibacillus oceani]
MQQFFIGIVLPDEYKQQVIVFRDRWASNGLREVVEPHITVKAQSGLTIDLAWLDKVRRTCSIFPRFKLSLSEPKTFGTAVAFLSVESKEIYDLHRCLMDAVAPSPELVLRYELDGFHPHLTLGQTLFGMEDSEIEEMKNQANNVLAPFPTFDVTFVRVYKEIQPNKYLPYEDIQLAT